MAGATALAMNNSKKLFGRAFYESIGNPKLILAPMVDQSEWAWRMLSRSFLSPESTSKLLTYTPMMHSRMFTETQEHRDKHFEPLRCPLPSPANERLSSELKSSECYLDGNPKFDRPLFVQFCANSPDTLLQAARYVEPFCDAVDLNLGCPQGIARKGHYGAFLQEDWSLIYQMINKLHQELTIPVTAKIRILETKEKTLDYAKMVLSAGASIITVHGRHREQKGHMTGLADWTVIRYLRDHLPPETVIFANGNILQHDDIQRCLDATGADGIMSAEGNLSDPSIFSDPPPLGEEGREYWRGKNGKGGYRVDAVFRRYLDILYKYVLEIEPPKRAPLFVFTDQVDGPLTEQALSLWPKVDNAELETMQETTGGERKKNAKRSINMKAMQPHMFQLLRQFVSVHTDVRNALAKCRAGDMEAYEKVLAMVEARVMQGIIDYERQSVVKTTENSLQETTTEIDESRLSSKEAIARCKRPWWVCQPYVRPLPAEAIAKGAITLSAKEKKKYDEDKELARAVGLNPEGTVQTEYLNHDASETVDVPKEGLVCG